MAATAQTPNVLSPHYDCFFEAAASAQGSARPRPPKAGTRVRTSHYRPFSTLYTESPYIEPSRLKRASSIGGLHLAAMGLNFTGGKDKDKGKAKEEASPSARVPAGVSEFGMFKTPGKPKLAKSPLGGADTLPQRPSTSSGVTSASTSNPKNTFFRMKKKRSMASIFSSAPSESGSGTSSSSSNATVLGSPDLPGSPGSTISIFSSPGASSSGSHSPGTSSSTFTTGSTSSPLAASSHHVIAPSPRSDSGATIKTSGHNHNKGVSFRVADGEGTAAASGSDILLDSSASAFVRKTNWAMRQNMTMHPYQDEYPYMRSYDPVLLESDRHTDMLLQHLSQGAPSFHDYRVPPSTVLDLGCGVGHWALNTANVWRNSQITGFDLVNITSPAFEYSENLQFVQGSFLDNPLPFADGSFEYVRMANLILCIPHEKWSAVLAEVHRVLAPGGRLEVIDDEMCFPYADKPKERKKHGKKRSVSSFEESDSEGSDNLFEDSRPKRHDDDSTETESAFFSETSSRPTSFDSKGSHRGSPPLIQLADTEKAEQEEEEAGLSESVTVRPISAMIGRAPMSAFLPPTPPFATPAEPAVFRATDHPHDLWERQAWASRDMERIFDMMLGRTYGIFPRFSDRVVDLMQGVFGEGAAGKVSSFHVKLAPVDSPIGVQARARAALEAAAGAGAFGDGMGEMKKGWKMTKGSGGHVSKEGKEKERDRKTSGAKKDEPLKGDSPTGSATTSKRSSLDVSLMLSTPLPASLNAKAAARLGLPSTTNSKAAQRLGYDLSPDKPSFTFTTDKNKKLPKTPNDHVDSSDEDDEDTVALDKARSTSPRPPSIKTSSSPPSSSPPTPTTLTPNTPVAATSTMPASLAAAPTPTLPYTLPPQPPVINAKAAMRLGIQPTTGEILPVQTPGSGHNHSLQSPGLLIWPSTYIAMSPVELEMHACKNVHTLLGCRPALYEFVKKQLDNEGNRLASDDEFSDAIWDYECFRRSRLNWPSPSMDPYDDDTAPNGTETVNIKSSNIMPMGNQDSFNGQYLRNSLVHLRTIRVFTAVKGYDEKSPVMSSATLLGPPKATPMIRSRSDSSRA